LLLVVAAAAVLRLWGLADVPTGLNQDEAVNGYDAYALGLTLRDHHGHLLPVALEAFGDWASPLLTYLTIPFVRLLGLSVLAIRLPVALLGIASVPLLYVLVRKLYRRDDVALVAAALLAVAPWSILTSRFAIPPNIVPFFTVLFVLALSWCAADDAKGPSAIVRTALAAAAGAALTYTYPTQKLFVPLMIVVAAAIVLRKRPAQALVLAGVFALLVAPIYELALFHPETNERFRVVEITGTRLGRIAGVMMRYVLYLSPSSLFGSGDDDPTYHVPGFGTDLVVLAPFFYLGVFFAVLSALGRRSPLALRRTDAALLLAWLALFPVAGSLTRQYMHLLRGIHGFPLVPLFSAAGIAGLIGSIAPARLALALRALLALFVVVGSVRFSYAYFTRYPEISKAPYQYGLEALFAYLVAHRAECRSVAIDREVNQAYIYLLFYARRDPRSLPYDQLRPHRGRIARFENVQFDAKVTKARVAHLPLVDRVTDGSRTWYTVYDGRGSCLVRQEIPQDPTAPPPP
jgi:4-amino-4-deoxy-L-arabinose transferase-like glycosyltransferase